MGAVGDKLLSGIDELGEPAAAVGSGTIIRRRLAGSSKWRLAELAAGTKCFVGLLLLIPIGFPRCRSHE